MTAKVYKTRSERLLGTRGRALRAVVPITLLMALYTILSL